MIFYLEKSHFFVRFPPKPSPIPRQVQGDAVVTIASGAMFYCIVVSVAAAWLLLTPSHKRPPLSKVIGKMAEDIPHPLRGSSKDFFGGGKDFSLFFGVKRCVARLWKAFLSHINKSEKGEALAKLRYSNKGGFYFSLWGVIFPFEWIKKQFFKVNPSFYYLFPDFVWIPQSNVYRRYASSIFLLLLPSHPMGSLFCL